MADVIEPGTSEVSFLPKTRDISSFDPNSSTENTPKNNTYLTQPQIHSKSEEIWSKHSGLPTVKTGSETSKPTSRGGGFTCCVPECYNNSKRNKDIQFYVIPKDLEVRKKWLNLINRKKFQPSTSHRVCSTHFVGGRKTYMNNLPLVPSKPKLQTPTKPRITNNSSGSVRRMLFPKVVDNIANKENTCENSQSQCDLLKEEIVKLKENILKMKNEHKMKVDELQFTISELENSVKRNEFSLERFKDDPSLIKFYTGFVDYEVFKCFFEYLGPAVKCLVYCGSNSNGEKINTPDYIKHGRKRKIPPEEELFIVLARLRCGLLEQDLAVRCNLSVSQISRLCITWIDFLHSRLRALPIWATQDTIQMTMPMCFKEAYPNTRVIIDCTEIFIQMPTSFRSQSATFSSYKHHNTAKGLLGIAPNGAITYVSDLYTGRTSDKEIVKDCGILKLLEKDDTVMADRGFDIENELPQGVKLNIPPFLNGKAQLSLEEETKTRRIASVRIHVERAIERVKNFRILQSVYPISMAADLNKIWIICSYLCNFLPPLVT